MDISDLDYQLPPELIAQHPLPQRDASRLMVIDRERGAIEHRVFGDIASYLHAPDLIVLNDTRVKPVRLYARRAGTGGLVEIFLLEPRGEGFYRAMTGSGGRLEAGEVLKVCRDEKGIEEALLEAELLGKHSDGTWEVGFSSPRGEAVDDAIAREARMPLPPYIKRERFGDAYAEEDKERYQTVFAKNEGAVAAPTAGLHFTKDLLKQLQDDGVDNTSVTLHVGPGTFKPVKVDRVEDHDMHAEAFELPLDTANAINEARSSGGRVVAVGTTVTRVLESCGGGEGGVRPQRGETDLMILPGHKYEVVDVLLTNFHLPRSTLLALVMAFAGEELVREAYAAAIAERYRFFSYGDAMLIV